MYAGLRVIDCSDESGQLAGRILADLGAEVVKVEPPGGEPLRGRAPFAGGAPDPDAGLAWIAWNAGKGSRVLDLDDAADREALDALLGKADVLLETFAPSRARSLSLDPASIAGRHPRLVHCSITPFGTTGPRADWRAGDLVVVAMGGNAVMTGHPDGPPLRCTLPTSVLHAAPEAVAGIGLALLERRVGGRGQHVDVSAQECQVATLLSGPGQLALTGRAGSRGGDRLGRTREIWRAKDGWVSFGLRGGPARVKNLIATVAYMAESDMAPDWLRELDWEAWNPQAVDDDLLARVEDAFGAFFAVHTMRELYEESLRRRILLAPCNDGREVLAHPQLRSRDLFARVAAPGGTELELPAFFARWDGEGALHVRGPAPRLDEWVDADQPDDSSAPVARVADPPTGGALAGTKILELGSGAAGPVAARYFIEQGATVVRVESARHPDFLRLLQPEGRRGLDRAPMFAMLNTDKQSLALDMGHEDARRLLLDLVAWADVVAENFAPGVLERWGVDFAEARRRDPALLVVHSCLFGQTGPQRHYPGFGGQGSAIAGFNHLTGSEDGPALGPYATITDSLSPRYLAAALSAALYARTRTGRGGELDVSQIEAGVYALSEMVLRASASAPPARRLGNRSEWMAPHAILPCREGWLALAVRDDADWVRLAAELAADGVEVEAGLDTAARLARAGELEAVLAKWTALHEALPLAERLQAVGLEAGPVQTFADLLLDPQLAHRDHFVRVPHGELGELVCERSALRLSRCPGRLERAGPLLGEHSRELLADLLGLDAARIEALDRAEVLR